jgi:hypothetical protein
MISCSGHVHIYNTIIDKIQYALQDILYSDKNILPKLKGKLLYQSQFDLLSLHAWISNQFEQTRVSRIVCLYIVLLNNV